MKSLGLALACLVVLLNPAALRAQSPEGSIPSTILDASPFPAGSWSPLGAFGQPVPRARLSTYAIYDPVGQRMVVFGGWGNGYFDDTWSLSMSDPMAAWQQIATTGPRPSPRLEHTTIYDPVRHRMLLFGGKDLNHFFNDVWQLDLATDTWSQLAIAGTPPSPRESRAVYDPGHDRMVIFGGYGYPYHLNETWALELSGTPTWHPLATVGGPPPKRRGQTGVYDSQGDRMIVFGGYDDIQLYNDVWTLDFSGTPTWHHVSVTGTPPSRRVGHGATYDPHRNEMVVFGGWNGVFRNDLYVLSLTGTPKWTEPALTVRPPVRDFHSMIYDAPRRRIVLFDGNDSSPISDLWSFDPSVPAWTELTAPASAGPAPRLSTYPIVDPQAQRLVLFGGWGNEYFDDTWAYSLANPSGGWEKIAPFGPHPSARLEHTTIYDPVRHRMLLFGGKNLTTFFNDVWQLDLVSDVWSPLPTQGIPPSPRESRAVYDPVRDRLLIFGGYGYPNHLNEVWALNLSGIPTWEQIEPGKARESRKHQTGVKHRVPDPRRGHGVVYDTRHDRLVVFGGYDDQQFFDDVWELRFHSRKSPKKWRQLKPHGKGPTPRVGHSTTYVEEYDQMVVFGGHDGQFLDDGYALSLDGKLEWSELGSETPGPSARDFHGMIWDAPRERLVLYGGNDGSPLGDMWTYGIGASLFKPVDPLSRRSLDPDATVPHESALGFALDGFASNPSRNGAVAFSLSTSERATVELFDVVGRRMASMVLDAPRPGSQVVRFNVATLSPGMYLVRLRQGNRVAVARGVLIR